MLNWKQKIYLKMAQQMLEVCNQDLEPMTSEIKNIIGNLGLDPTESWLDQNFCWEDNDDPKKKKIRKTRATSYSSTKMKARSFLVIQVTKE